MQNGTSAAARAVANGFVRQGTPYSPEELSAEWVCKKRDGKTVPFDPDKIRRALRKCFAALADDPAENYDKHDLCIERITRAVVNSLVAQHDAAPDVETVQRLVIQQLWGEGLFVHAEHYQNHREERRKARSARSIPQDVIDRVLEDQKHFPTDLQYYQFMGKFARWRDEDKRRETWRETVYQRVIPWFQKLPAVQDRLSQGEWDELADSMFDLQVSPAMRVVQMAGPALDRCHVGVYNCGTKSTQFVSNTGVLAFADCADGDRVTVFTHTGTWRPATVRAYGRGDVHRITLQRGNSYQEVEFTADHRWLLEDGTVTTSLKEGDRLWRTPDPFAGWDYDNADVDEKLYWAYGFVYGDGTLVKKAGKYTSSMVRLCGEKVRFLERFQELGFSHSYPPSQDNEPTVYTGRYLKGLPDPGRDGVGRVRAFVRGWLDADGCRNTNGGPNEFSSIQVTGQESVNFVRKMFPAVGAYITGEKDMTGQETNYGVRSDTTVLFRLMFTNGTSPNTSYRVAKIDRPRRADLWCLEVDGDRSFVLPSGVVTGNCAYHPLDDLFAFPELLYILMQGSGAGFSVETDYVSELPRIKKQKGKKPETIVVPDTTEGWCASYFEGLQRWWDGYDVWYDTHLVRRANARLKTKGGRSSGPGPLLELLAFARNMVMARQGRYLEDTDAHRLGCFTGRIVQVGGVRRASSISLSDLMSLGMRGIKMGPWYNDTTYWPDGKYLTMANNSAVYDERPTAEQFMEEWLSLMKSRSGERGIFNRQAAVKHRPRRRKSAKFGMNPCGEILLRPYEFCNLTICIAKPTDTVDSLKRKVRLATIFGVIQSTCTNFGYIRPDWKKNCEEERLLGVDITGHAECPLLRHGAPGRANLLRQLREVVAQTRREFSRRFGINESAADTCVKPGGDSGVFFNCGSGVSPWFGSWTVRWVRESKDSPVAQFLVDSGVPHAPAPEAPEALLVFGFPRPAPAGATTRKDMSAIDQLENWLEWKKEWAEHSVACTVYIDEHEWLEAGAWVYKEEHWEYLNGLSFLPRDNGIYTYAPNEEVTKDQYDRLVAGFPDLNWAKLQHFESEDMTEGSMTPACAAGGCAF